MIRYSIQSITKGAASADEAEKWRLFKILSSCGGVPAGVFRLVFVGSISCFSVGVDPDIDLAYSCARERREMGACADVEPHAGLRSFECTLPAYCICGAGGRGAFSGGCELSGNVPKSHGLARSAWRVNRRGLWRGAGYFDGAVVFCNYALGILFWSACGDAGVCGWPPR